MRNGLAFSHIHHAHWNLDLEKVIDVLDLTVQIALLDGETARWSPRCFDRIYCSSKEVLENRIVSSYLSGGIISFIDATIIMM